jgi:hypothetical protein
MKHTNACHFHKAMSKLDLKDFKEEKFDQNLDNLKDARRKLMLLDYVYD